MNVTLPELDQPEVEMPMAFGDDDPKPLFAELDAPIDRLFRQVYERGFYTYAPHIRARFKAVIDNPDNIGANSTGVFHEPFEPAGYQAQPEELSDEERDAQSRLEFSFSG